MYQHVKFERRTSLTPTNDRIPTKDAVEFTVCMGLWAVWVIIMFCY